MILVSLFQVIIFYDGMILIKEENQKIMIGDKISQRLTWNRAVSLALHRQGSANVYLAPQKSGKLVLRSIWLPFAVYFTAKCTMFPFTGESRQALTYS